MKQIYKKLVRDKIPKLIKDCGNKVTFKILKDDNEFKDALYLKLSEEVNELLDVLKNDPKNKKAIMEEVADIKEVCDAILDINEIDTFTASNFQINKNLLKGGFEKRIYLEEVENETTRIKN